MNDVRLGLLPWCLRPAAGALVAIVLLIGAVVLQQLDAVLAEEVVCVAQLLANVAAQIIALES